MREGGQENSGEEREQDGKEVDERAGLDEELNGEVRDCPGTPCGEGVKQDGGEHSGGGSAEQGEEDGFGDELAEEAGACGSDGDADAELAGAVGHAGGEESAEIGAGGEENEEGHEHDAARKARAGAPSASAKIPGRAMRRVRLLSSAGYGWASWAATWRRRWPARR